MPENDSRPGVWVGHVELRSTDVAKTREFMVKLGMRDLGVGEVAILELRGGTHLVVLPAEAPASAGAKAPFDLMVDDIDAANKRYTELGLNPSGIEEVAFHRKFTLTEPGGHEITVNSSHVSGEPV